MFGNAAEDVTPVCAGTDASAGQVEGQDDTPRKGERWQGRRHTGQCYKNKSAPKLCIQEPQSGSPCKDEQEVEAT